MQATDIERASEERRREEFIARANAAYTALREDPVAWSEVLAERALWESTLMDGLDPSERWLDDGTVVYSAGG